MQQPHQQQRQRQTTHSNTALVCSSSRTALQLKPNNTQSSQAAQFCLTWWALHVTLAMSQAQAAWAASPVSEPFRHALQLLAAAVNLRAVLGCQRHLRLLPK
jgi:hypothetical protein